MKSIAPSVQRRIRDLLDSLLDGGTEIITIEELEKKLIASILEERQLRIKQGIDPTSPDVHIGHMVPFRKMRIFQDAGHVGVLIIGDFTAQIGDPTGLDAERNRLSLDETKKNAETYCRQIFRIVDDKKVEVHNQSSWFSGTSLLDAIDLTSHFSVAHLLSHETFRKRLTPGSRLSLHELFYPALQAYDSVQISADVELGGTDQKFNILCGRDLMKSKGMDPQVALLTPLLAGTDGRKMSKSFGNAIAVESGVDEKVAAVMSTSDDMMAEYMSLGAGMTSNEVAKMMSGLSSGKLHPKEAKMEVAKRMSLAYHSKPEVDAAAEKWDRVVSKRMVPEDVDFMELRGDGVGIVSLLTSRGMAKTTSEVRRLIQQGAVTLDGEKISDSYYHISPCTEKSRILKVGKRRLLRID